MTTIAPRPDVPALPPRIPYDLAAELLRTIIARIEAEATPATRNGDAMMLRTLRDAVGDLEARSEAVESTESDGRAIA